MVLLWSLFVGGWNREWFLGIVVVLVEVKRGKMMGFCCCCVFTILLCRGFFHVVLLCILNCWWIG